VFNIAFFGYISPISAVKNKSSKMQNIMNRIKRRIHDVAIPPLYFKPTEKNNNSAHEIERKNTIFTH
uniref:hypothetical protein n=1 Tax=Lonsdalea britannica TaxID=1082704 RepID=UPI0026E9B62B